MPAKPSLRDLQLAGSAFVSLPTLTLATCGPEDGEEAAPHAAPVYFVADDRFRLYFFSDPQSQHGQDLARNPHAAAALYPEVQDWQEIHGLQLRGVVRLVEDPPEWQRAWERYAGKFPFVAALKLVVARNAFYVFIPGWIRLVDNRRGFGFKQEWILEEGK